MKKTLIILGILLFSFVGNSTNYNLKNKDSIDISRKLYELEHKVQIIDNNQLNYKIEKDILKETYKNNYEQLNLIITIVLGIIGILGYLGIKDINSIKKEYLLELESLKDVQRNFVTKSNEFDNEKEKFDNEISEIIKQNEIQNRKIKIIELKEKTNNLMKERKLNDALSFINVTLDLSPKDIQVLNNKGRVLCRLNQLDESIKSFEKALEYNPKDESTLINLVECLFFANKIEKAKKLISSNQDLILKQAEGQLENFLELFELFHSGNKDKLIERSKLFIDFDDLKTSKKRIVNWDLEEAKYVAAHQEKSELRLILQNTLWFIEGTMNGEEFCKRIKIDSKNKK
jgi:tetratricopeptide (TPR) repeat protein